MKNMFIGLTIACLVVLSFSFAAAQSITVQDNASTTAPIQDVRVFGTGYTSTVGFQEVASSSDLVAPLLPGAILFQFNTDDKKLTIRVLDSDGAGYTADVQMADL